MLTEEEIIDSDNTWCLLGGPGICLRLASLSHYVRAQIPLGRAPLESQRGADCEGKKREWVRNSESCSGGLACLGLNK